MKQWSDVIHVNLIQSAKFQLFLPVESCSREDEASLESSLIALQAKTITHRAYERDYVEVDDKELCQPFPDFHYRLTSTQSVTN